MKSSILIAAAASMAVATVAAQNITPSQGRLYYSEPVSATVWTAGESHTVSWTNYCRPGNKDRLDIVLYVSKDIPGSNNQTRVPGLRALGSLNCLSNKSANVTLPKGLTSGSTYSLHVDTVPYQSYSAQFTIKGEDPVVVATTAVVDPATAAATATATTAAPATTTSGSTEVKDKVTNAASGSVKAAIASTVALVAMAAGSVIL